MALTIGLAMRSIYVPSSARRTFSLCFFAGVPIVASMSIAVVSADKTTIDQLTGGHWRGTVEGFGFYVAINVVAWWTLSIALCTSASHVIYGLRSEASKARRLGQYTLQKRLGQGGMGEVYLARHAMLRRPTAIKLLRPEKAGENNLARFEREVQLTAQLTHPNTVTIFDYGRTPEGVFYYAMELLDGYNLDEIVEFDGPQPVARVIHILEQIASALIESHGVGLIHRDIKPANLILCRQGGKPDVAKVVDFGLVKDVTHGEDIALTNPEIITGTPLYMSPEAIRNPASVDNRSDLYALGAVGYLLLTGTKLFGGESMVEVCGHHLHTQPEPPSQRLQSEVPQKFEELILSCLEKDPKDRPQSAADLHARLLDCQVEPRWNDELANQWWTTKGEKLRERLGDRQDSSIGETLLAIDLEKRGRSD
jgi:serine/threonine-protein kinase